MPGKHRQCRTILSRNKEIDGTCKRLRTFIRSNSTLAEDMNHRVSLKTWNFFFVTGPFACSLLYYFTDKRFFGCTMAVVFVWIIGISPCIRPDRYLDDFKEKIIRGCTTSPGSVYKPMDLYKKDTKPVGYFVEVYALWWQWLLESLHCVTFTFEIGLRYRILQVDYFKGLFLP